jgi:hypothetical protein
VVKISIGCGHIKKLLQGVNDEVEE